jgi:protein NRD1
VSNQIQPSPADLLAALAGPPPAQPTPPVQAAAQAPPPPANNQAAQAQLLAALLAAQQPTNPQVPMQYTQANNAVNFPPQPPVAPPPQSTSVAANPYNNMLPVPPPVNSNPLAAFFPNAQQPPQPAADSNAANQMQALQALAQNPEAIKTFLAALGIPVPQVPGGQVPQMPQLPVSASMPQSTIPYASGGSQAPQQNQSYGRDDGGFDPRARSRSPDYKRRRVSPPNRRESPTYGTYNPHTSDNGSRGQDWNRRGRKGDRSEYRQRTPERDFRDSPPIPKNRYPKPYGFDATIPEGHIKGKSFEYTYQNHN